MQRFLARFPAYAKVSSRVPGFRVFWLMQDPPKSRLQGVPVLPDSAIQLLQSPSSVGDPGQQGFFHGDGLLWTHLLTAVTLDALAVIILRLAVSHFYGLAFYRAGTYADPAAHTFFQLHHRLLFQEWLQKTDRL